MPRLTIRVPAYRLHKSTGQAVVSIDGKRFYIGKYRSRASRERYSQLINEWLARNRELPPSYRAADEAITVVELMAQYLTYAKGYYVKDGRPTGELDVIKSALRPLKELYGRTSAPSFGPLGLEVVRNRMIESGWARTNINRQVRRIIRMFRWGASREFFPVAVADQLTALEGLRAGRTAARDRRPVEPVADDVVNQTLAKLPSVVADMVRFQRLTGARPGEVCDLRPCDVNRSGEIWLYSPASHKTQHHGKQRVICIGPQAQQILQPYLLRSAEVHCFSPAESERKRLETRHNRRQTPLSYGNRPGTNRKKRRLRQAGTKYTRDSYRRAIQRACGQLKIDTWSPNQLRHTAATEIRRRFGLEAAQVALGHAQASVTQIYAERDLGLAIRVAQEVG